jgi:hypothetical protein
MVRLLAALMLFPALAVHAQSGDAEQPMETAGPLAIWIFAILFFGAIALYAWMTWRGGKTRKDAARSKPERG